MILAILAFLVANAAVGLGARALARSLWTDDPAIDFLQFLLLRLALISVAVLAAGTAGALTPLALGTLGTLGLAGLLAAGAHRLSPLLPALPPCGPAMKLALAVVVFRLVAQVWFFAPYNYDALSYHLTKVAEWVRVGGFTREMGVDTHAPFPAGFELLETWWVVFLRHDVLIEAAGVEFLLLAFASVRVIASRLGLNNRAGMAAALLYVLTPGLHLQATSCLNDAAVAALVLATFALVLAPASMPSLLLPVGLGFGVKPTYAYALGGVLLLLWLRRKEPRAVRPRLSVALLLVLLAATPGLFWYGRNALWFGNPIHPVGSRGLIAETGEKKIQFGPSFASAARNVLALAEERVVDRGSPQGSLLVRISGWGPVAFACGILCLLSGLANDLELRRLALCFGVSLVGVLGLVNHDPWYMRFVLFFPALLTVATIKAAPSIPALPVVLLPCLAFQFAATIVPADLSWPDVRTLARMSWHERSAAALVDAQSGLDRIGYFGLEPVHNRGESYLLYQPDYSTEVVHLRSRAPADLAREMRERGVRVLYASRPSLNFPNPVDEALRLGLLRRLGGRFFERIE